MSDSKSKRIRVEICAGTTCHVMGGSRLIEFEERLSELARSRVEILGVTCLDGCKNGAFGKAPFARMNGELIAATSIDDLVSRMEAQAGWD